MADTVQVTSWLIVAKSALAEDALGREGEHVGHFTRSREIDLDLVPGSW